MSNNRLLKIALSLLLAFAMTFAPVVSSYAAIAAEPQADTQQPAVTQEENVSSDGQNETESAQPEGAEQVPDASADEGSAPEDQTQTKQAEEADEAEKTESVTPQPSEAEPAEAKAAEPEEAEKAEEPENTRTVYTWKGNAVKVTAVLSDADAVPDDAKLVVTPVVKGTKGYNYDAYMDALNKGGSSEYTDKNTMLYDIAFIKDGVEIEPEAGKVSVSFEFLDSQLSESIGAKKSSDVNVIHLPLTDTVKEKYDTTADAKNISADDIIVEEVTKSENGLAVSVKNEKVEFQTSDFSVFAYTVDFEYIDAETGKVYTYNLEGTGSITLKELVVILGITSKEKADDFIKNVDDVKFSNEDLVKVENTRLKGWVLKSLAPFSSEELLTITMKDGTVIQVKVTDMQYSIELDQFLTKVSVSGASLVDGHYVVEEGKVYKVTMTFKETSDLQFADFENLTYQMPEGITLPNGLDSVINIAIVSGGNTYEIPATVRADDNGLITVKFDESDPDFHKLVSASNVGFRIQADASFSQSIDHEKWGEKAEIDIILDTEDHSSAFAQKSASYDEDTGTFTYTIVVKAEGNPTNVNVKDVISGNVLIFNNDVQVTGNTSTYTSNQMPTGQQGFDYTFASMQDGEEITITYSAKLDPENIPSDGKITTDMTRNTVTVTPDDGEPHNSSYSHEINLKKPKKSTGTEVGTTADGKKIYSWRIDYNSTAIANAAGDTITDKIGESSQQYMKYYEDVTVKVYNKSDDLVDTRSFTPGSDYTWTYTVPDGDTTPYHYVFEYKTIVDQAEIDNTGVPANLINDVEGPGGKDSEGIVVEPKEKTTITKEVESSSEQEVTWVSHIHVPEGGLTQAVVTDTVPTIWSRNIGKTEGYSLYDLYKNGSLEITGTIDGESYDLNTDSQDKIVITFYKDPAHSEPGLKGQDGGHVITVRLTTKVNQEWLEAGYDYPTTYQSVHENTININDSVEAKANVRYVEPGIEKRGAKSGDRRFKYTLYVSHVNSSPIIVNDTFDTSVLEVDHSKDSADYNLESLYITGGDSVGHIWVDYDKVRTTKVDYSDTANGIQITANNVPKQDNGEYYPVYMITYFLKLKDGVDPDALAIENGGKYELTNTARWGEHESSYTFEYKYDYLDKELLKEATPSDRKVKYKITFNPEKAELNDGQDITMTDTLNEHLSIDYTSIQIETDPPGISVPYSLSGDDNGQTIATYTIPDSTKVTITYEAMVVGNGRINYVNTVEANGEHDVIDETETINIEGEGQGATADLHAVKVDGYDANKKLAGVRFKLYPKDSTISLNFEGEPFLPYKEIVTDENGVLSIDGDTTYIIFGEQYYLEELDAPPDYAKLSFPYQFTLVDNMDEVDYQKYVYFYTDTLQIKNWPLEGLVVEKQVESDDQDDHDIYFNFRISILDENGNVDTTYNEKNGDDQFTNGVFEFSLKDKERKMFWGFLKGTKYKVEELDGEGFAKEVTYSIFDEDGNVKDTITEAGSSHSGELTQEDEVIVFKNSKTSTGSLKVKKTVTGEDADQNKNFEFNVELNNTAISGTYGDMTFNGGVATFTLKHGEELVATGLPTGTHYIVTEKADPDYVAVITNGEGDIVSDKTGTTEVSIENKKTDTISITTEYPVTKKWVGDDPATRPENLTIRLLQDDQPTSYAHSAWVKDGNTWTCKFENLPVFAEDGHAYSYKAVEENAPSGYTQGEPVIVETKYELDPDITTGDYEIVHSCKNTSFVIDTFLDLNFLIIKRTQNRDPLVWTQRPMTDDEKRMLVAFSHAHVFREYSDDIADYEFISGFPVYYYDDASHSTPAPSGLNDMSIQYADNKVYLRFGTHAEWAQYAKGTYHQKSEYIPGSTTLTNSKTGGIKVLKTAQLNGTTDPTAEGKKFTVALFSDASGTEQVGQSKEITIGSDGTGEVTFDGLTVGTTYYVFEMDGDAKAGAKIGEYTVVTGSGNAQATAEISNTVNLVNNKKTGDLKVSKTLSGNDTEPDKVFHFDITVAGASGSYEAEGKVRSVTFGEDGKATVELKGDEHVLIKGLPDGAAYSVSEREANQDDYITSSDDASGTISADKTADAAPHAAFTNTRNKGGLTITKTFAGNTDKLTDADKAKISFTVTGPEWTEPQTFTYADMPNGVKTFEKIKLGDYTVTETTGEGKTYTTKYKVGSDETETEGTSAAVNVGANGNSVTFTNTYQETEITLDAEKMIEAKAGTTVPAKTFEFSMSAGEVVEAGEATVPMPQDTTASITGAGKVSSGTDPFGSITYTKPGTYTYIITETTASGSGWTCNTGGDVTATVTVTADVSTGALSAAASYDKANAAGDAAIITNKYDATGKAQFKANKLYNRMNAPAGKFSFELKAEGAESGEVKANAAEGIVLFDEIEYKLSDLEKQADGTVSKDFRYTIKEVIPEGATETPDGKYLYKGITYDPTVHNITVTVKDVGTGTLSITAKDDKGTGSPVDMGISTSEGVDIIQVNPYFENTYHSEAETQFTAHKELTGKKLEAGMFTFELKKKNASGKYEVIDTQTNDADGKVTFRTLKYEYDPVAGKNDIGDHEYTISEVKPEPKAGDNVSEDGKTINGITYDDKVVEVKVNVKDNEDGTMTLTYNGEKEFAGAEFTNTYSAKGNGEIKVQKLLEGRDWTDNDSFTFTLTGVSAPEGVQTVPMPANKSITIKKSDKDQTRSFGEIEFTKAGTYTYTVKETKGTAGGVTYDEKEHTVTFKAVDDGKGRIVADQGSQMIQTEKITNTYSAAGCVGSILVQKSLKGREWKDDDEFEFTLTGENGAPMPDEDTITITKDDKDHIAGFGNITFTKAGKYTYTVKETKGDAKGMTYDTKKHKVTIEVIDDGNGKLVAKSGTDLIQTVKITNTYSSGGIKTGDSSPIVLYSIITVTALILLLIAMFVRRRQNRAE